MLKEINGKAMTDLVEPPKDPKSKEPGKVLKTAGQQLDGFGQLRDDGSTMCGNWLYSGVYTDAGNNAARRNTADPIGSGACSTSGRSAGPPTGASCTTAPPPTPPGKPWDPKRVGIQWNGEKWVGDVPDIKPDCTTRAVRCLHHASRGRRAALLPRCSTTGPFPEHYEAVEAPVENVLHPKVTASPVLKRFTSDKDKWGKADEYPIVCTTYRLTEHFHYWTKHQAGGRLNEVQPGHLLRDPRGAGEGEGHQERRVWCAVTSARGSIEGPAMVTRRMPRFMLDGKRVWQIGFPIHWGYSGDAKHAGPLANLLTTSAIDPNTWTPEFKAFQVQAGEGRGGSDHVDPRPRDHPVVRVAPGHRLRTAKGAQRRASSSTPRPASAARRARWPARSGTTSRTRRPSRTAATRRCPSLDADFWNLIKFHEVEVDGNFNWLMRKDQCMHCADPGCLKACPAPGAIVQYSNGTST